MGYRCGSGVSTHIARFSYRSTGIVTPIGVTGLRIWLDCSQESFANGAAMATFTDKSGNGNNFTGVATAQPLFTLNVVNGRPVARFDGSNDTLSKTGLAADTSYTTFLVAGKRTAPGIGSSTLWSVANGAQLFTASGTHATAYNWFQNQAAATQANVAPAAATLGILVLRVNSAASFDIYKNGGTATNFDPNDILTTATQRFLASESGTSNWGDFDIAELVEYDSALTVANINTVGTYLSNKYNIAWTTAA